MIISHYWRQEATLDKLARLPPKEETFFVAWFGPSGVATYQAYKTAYDAEARRLAYIS